MRYKQRRGTSSFLNIKLEITGFINRNKILVFTFIIFTFVALLTGIMTAIKNNSCLTFLGFDDYSLVQFLNGNLGTVSLFFSRLFSYLLSMLLILISSFSIFLIPLNFGVIIFRSYLVGLNCTLLIILFGVGGILTGLLIVLPCQLVILILMMSFAVLCCKAAFERRKFGSVCGYNKMTPFQMFCIFLIIITLINILETILLAIFSNKIILVI